MKKTGILKIPKPFFINYCNSYKSIVKWKIDKYKVQKETNIVKKIEFYNYFNIEDISKLIKYLSSKNFKYTNKAKEYPRHLNIILNMEDNFITGKGKILCLKEKMPKYFYRVFWSKILVYKRRTYLIKVYWNIAEKKDFFKLEITYSYFKPKGKYNIHFLDWLNASKGINGIIRRIEKEFTPIGFDEDFSKQVFFEVFILEMMGKIGRSKVNHIYNIFDKLTGNKIYSKTFKNSFITDGGKGK